VIRRVAAVGVVGAAISLAAIAILRGPSDQEPTGAGEVAAPEHVRHFYCQLLEPDARVYAGTVGSISVTAKGEGESKWESGTFQFLVEKRFFGQPRDSISLPYDVLFGSDGKPPHPNESEPGWKPPAGKRFLLIIYTDSSVVAEVEQQAVSPKPTFCGWGLPANDLFYREIPEAISYIEAADDAGRIAAYKRICSCSSMNLKWFAGDAIFETVTAVKHRANDPWNRAGRAARCVLMEDFIRSVAPSLIGTDFDSPHVKVAGRHLMAGDWGSVSQMLAWCLADETGPNLPDELRRAAAGWYWDRLAPGEGPITGPNLGQRIGAVDGLFYLEKRNGPAWILALFKDRGRDEFLKRFEAACAKFPPKDAEAAKALLVRLKAAG
jgi:hypothetical protein